ncbi:hypothetical protein J8G26_08930 [Acidovorax sp. JG5]|uniref:hypothetical protein n=1 Tax=Acidovorax sp. JG5 TaxID=2822718 RepID=UPI001B31DE00|nr:hypothetical protein [Acidovorax sp. JG5]MBP3980850.1 hypothetical protein [Acidovorax sp. JG5]
MPDIGTIEIKLRSDGRIDMCSTFMGRKDAVYAAFPQERLAGHVAKLAHWLREQAVAELRRQADVHEAVLTSSPR